jgi:hypothetical protein
MDIYDYNVKIPSIMSLACFIYSCDITELCRYNNLHAFYE